MTLEEAYNYRLECDYIHGKKIGGQFVTHLVIIPTTESVLGEILPRLFRGENYLDILNRYSDFTVIGFYDLDPMETPYLWDTIDRIKEKIAQSQK